MNMYSPQHHEQKQPPGGNRFIPSDKPIKLARDPNKAMQQMMDIIDHLREVYVAETEALSTMDTNRFVSLQDEKLSKASAYESGIRELVARKDEMKSVDTHLKNKLNKMQEDFADLTQQNLNALERMSRTTERLGKTLYGAAKEAAKRERVFSYGENGRIDHDTKKQITTGINEEA